MNAVLRSTLALENFTTLGARPLQLKNGGHQKLEADPKKRSRISEKGGSPRGGGSCEVKILSKTQKESLNNNNVERLLLYFQWGTARAYEIIGERRCNRNDHCIREKH